MLTASHLQGSKTFFFTKVSNYTLKFSHWHTVKCLHENWSQGKYCLTVYKAQGSVTWHQKKNKNLRKLHSCVHSCTLNLEKPALMLTHNTGEKLCPKLEQLWYQSFAFPSLLNLQLSLAARVLFCASWWVRIIPTVALCIYQLLEFIQSWVEVANVLWNKRVPLDESVKYVSLFTLQTLCDVAMLWVRRHVSLMVRELLVCDIASMAWWLTVRESTKKKNTQFAPLQNWPQLLSPSRWRRPPPAPELKLKLNLTRTSNSGVRSRSRNILRPARRLYV